MAGKNIFIQILLKKLFFINVKNHKTSIRSQDLLLLHVTTFRPDVTKCSPVTTYTPLQHSLLLPTDKIVSLELMKIMNPWQKR